MLIDENILLIAAIYGVVVLVAFWVAMIIWVYRDMKARSRDTLFRLIFSLMTAVLTVPGLLIYFMLRPRETLSEAYERSLEEEALLQEIEEKPTCPGCSQRVDTEWQACAYCHTRLKKPCVHCSKMLELSWNLCPHCATSQIAYTPDEQVVLSSRHVHQPAPHISDQWLSSSQIESQAPQKAATNEPLEFIDGDDY